jgi:hypothetical protein
VPQRYPFFQSTFFARRTQFAPSQLAVALKAAA